MENIEQNLRYFITAILNTVRQMGPSGVPSKILFTVLQAYGCPEATWQTIEQSMVVCGKLVKRGDTLYYPELAPVCSAATAN